MKKLILANLATLGLCLTSPAADLTWSPTNSVWDAATFNWLTTGTTIPSVFTAGDNVLFDNSGFAQLQVKLVPGLIAGTVVVDATSDYTLTTNVAGGAISSLTSLTKRGVGKLVIDTDNTFFGPVTIDGGVLQVGNGAGRGTLGGGPITNLTGLVISRTGTLNMTNNLDGPGGFTNKLNATVNIYGTNTMTGPVLIQAGNLSLINAPARGDAADFILDASTASTANSRLGLTGSIDMPANVAITMVGTASSGPSRCTLQTPTATDTTTNSLNGPIRVGSGNGLIQLSAGSTGTGLLQINGNISNHPDNATPYSGSFYLRGAGNGILTGIVTLPEASLIRTDAGSFTVASTGNSWASILVAVGRLRVGIDDALPNTGLSLGQATGTNAILDLNGFNQKLTLLTSVHGINTNTPVIANSSTTADSILTISGPGGVYGGCIQDSIFGGTRKVGITILSGAQQLTTNCTYTGPTTIVGGGLSLVGAGSIPNTATIDIGTGAALDASFRSDGTFALGAGQTLKGNGTFNIVGNLTSQGTIELKANKSGAALTSDAVQGIAQVTYGGTLKLNLSGDSLVAGDSFKLFSAASYTGAFDGITPTTPATGLVWNTDTLTTDGILRVAAGVATTPTNLSATVVVGGTLLKLSWPSDYTGWTLQGQTNSIGTGLTSAWVDVPGSSTTNEITIQIDPANATAFFRLRYQP